MTFCPSKCPCDLAQNGTQEKTLYSGSGFQALLRRTIYFVASVSLKKICVKNGKNFVRFHEVLNVTRYFRLQKLLIVRLRISTSQKFVAESEQPLQNKSRHMNAL